MDKKDPDKKAKLLAALDKGMAMIHLDARRPGVLVPTALRAESHLRLNLSYRFEPPDLTVGEWGVRCTLSFAGSRFKVAVPWSALFAVTSHVTKEFWMYPDDMPPELIQQTMVTSKVPEAPPVERPRAVLREVSRQEPEESREPEASGEPEAPPSTPPVARAPLAALAPVALEPPEDKLPPEDELPAEDGLPKEEQPSPKRGGHLRLVK